MDESLNTCSLQLRHHVTIKAQTQRRCLGMQTDTEEQSMKNETSSTAFAIHQRYHARSNMPSKLFLIAIALTTFNLSNTFPPQNAVADEIELLTAKQQSVTQRYQRLEELLLRLAEVEATENPERSALLRRAAKQSRDKFVLEKLKLHPAELMHGTHQGH